MGVKLRSAPVFYTLVQFKFNSIAQMADYAPSVQEKLRRRGYPDYRQESMMSINIRRPDDPQPEVQNTQQKRWSFTNAKGTEGYLLFPDALIYHTTDYDTFETFSKKALDGLALVHEIVELSYIDRIGLRYLDSISPKAGEKVEEYLSPSLTGLSSIMKGSLNHAFSETAMDIDSGKLIARSVITDNGIAIPPDLMPLSLRLPEKVSSISHKNAVLDVDYFVTQRFDGIDLDLIQKQMTASHKIVTVAFNAAVTTHAINTWK
jgi:uncharacterized protein (TIGR04255 family)